MDQAKLVRYQKSLLEITKMDYFQLDNALNRIVQIDARTLNVERVSVWLFDGDCKEIVCETLYCLSRDSYEKGQKLRAEQYPEYFKALDANRLVVADDAENDLRTSEFKDAYLKPSGITSMMDVPIRIRGEIVGVVCHEHVGKNKRTWDLEDQDFAASIADMISLALALSAVIRAERELKTANTELKRLNRIRSDFTSMVSHELRTPLSSIKDSIQIILDGIDGPLTDNQKETLEIAGRNADRLARLIDNVLNLTRMESGQTELMLQKTDLVSLVKDVCGFLRPSIEKKNIIFSFEGGEEAVSVDCDSDKIRQVVINLIDNAIKFTGPGGRIAVRISVVPDAARIEVEDTGVGIKREDHQKIFERFGQVVDKGNWRAGSAGLGLALCKQIMTLHGGTIFVESEAGKGSRFLIEIPVRKNQNLS